MGGMQQKMAMQTAQAPTPQEPEQKTKDAPDIQTQL
jgi:hypothetical protein